MFFFCWSWNKKKNTCCKNMSDSVVSVQCPCHVHAAIGRCSIFKNTGNKCNRWCFTSSTRFPASQIPQIRVPKSTGLMSVIPSCHCVHQSSPVLLGFMQIAEPSSPRSAHHLRETRRERELARYGPWLLIHNSHCLLRTFQNSFRLWR